MEPLAEELRNFEVEQWGGPTGGTRISIRGQLTPLQATFLHSVIDAAAANPQSQRRDRRRLSMPHLWLIDIGDEKFRFIKALRSATGLGLAEAKALAEKAPCNLSAELRGPALHVDMNRLDCDLITAGANLEWRNG